MSVRPGSAEWLLEFMASREKNAKLYREVAVRFAAMCDLADLYPKEFAERVEDQRRRLVDRD